MQVSPRQPPRTPNSISRYDGRESTSPLNISARGVALDDASGNVHVVIVPENAVIITILAVIAGFAKF